MKVASRLPLLLTVAVLFPAGLSAQEHHRGVAPDSTDRMAMQMTQPGPRMLLHEKDALGLSDDQVRRLEEIQARIEDIRAEVLGVLTEEQRSNVHYGMRVIMHGMGPGAGMAKGMMDGRGGMMGRMEDMDRAPMMEMMRRMHRHMHQGGCPMAPDAGDHH